MATSDYCSGNIHMLQCLYLKCASKSMCKLVKSKNNFPHPVGSWCRALLLPCLSPQQGGERLYVQPDECILEQVRNWWQVHKSLIAVPMLVLERLPWLQRLTVCHCKRARTIRQVRLCTTSALTTTFEPHLWLWEERTQILSQLSSQMYYHGDHHIHLKRSPLIPTPCWLSILVRSTGSVTRSCGRMFVYLRGVKVHRDHRPFTPWRVGEGALGKLSDLHLLSPIKWLENTQLNTFSLKAAES